MIPAMKGKENKFLLSKRKENGFYVEENWAHDILPRDRYHMKLVDILVMGNLWRRQAQQIIDVGVKAEMVKQVIIRA